MKKKSMTWLMDFNITFLFRIIYIYSLDKIAFTTVKSVWREIRWDLKEKKEKSDV